ncbi:uncharacterized protein LOC100204430 [Hydra vulgaris]|uniref:uncharacterized protein LOC100204430 n=1 Tax=Hydra vulgaris TaxID=6087 RepID=UPI00019242EC|nr:uncharacterized protein LOC100204430 [Hydra vulgaris]
MAVQLNCGYLTSCLGIIKILEGICTLAAFVCMIDANFYRGIRENFFLGVNIASFIFVLVWFFCYLFMLCHHFDFANKVVIFVIVHLLWFVLLLISGALVAAQAARFTSWQCKYNKSCSIYEAAGGLGIVASFLFLIDAILIWKSMNTVTGTTSSSRTVTTTKTVVKTTRKV